MNLNRWSDSGLATGILGPTRGLATSPLHHGGANRVQAQYQQQQQQRMGNVPAWQLHGAAAAPAASLHPMSAAGQSLQQRIVAQVPAWQMQSHVHDMLPPAGEKVQRELSSVAAGWGVFRMHCSCLVADRFAALTKWKGGMRYVSACTKSSLLDIV